MYETDRMSQMEIATTLNVSLKRIQTAMRRFGIQSRRQVRREQRGTANPMWKGTSAGYQAFHKRVEAARGADKICARCGADQPSLSYDWANLTGHYDDINDYERMCRSCHRRYDNARRRGGDADV